MPPLNLYARVRFFVQFAHETAGAARTRSSLRPLISWGETKLQSLGATCRKNAKVRLLPPSSFRGVRSTSFDVQNL
jgi:hypothetical protein